MGAILFCVLGGVIIKLSVIIPVLNQESLILRAIDSIPLNKDIEIIVIDDGSTDRTYHNVVKKTNRNDIILLKNDKNMGVSYSVNRGLDVAKGEYVVLLGSDDYFITDNFITVFDKYLTGADLVYFDLEVNSGDVWNVTKDTTRSIFCGSVKFMRREFIGDTRNPVDKRAGEDWYFYQALLKKNPTEVFTKEVVKHYNFPRRDSLSNLASRGLL